MLNPWLLGLARAWAPRITLPFSMFIGYVGYNLEDWLSDKYTPSRKSAIERREERRANEGEAEFKVPETIFEKNRSPSLEKKD